MAVAALIALAMLLSALGMAWIALAMRAHWRDARGDPAGPPARAARVLRLFGAAAIVGALLLCLRADHASIAVLMWIMSLTAGAVAVALTLSWRPRWLAWTIAWVG